MFFLKIIYDFKNQHKSKGYFNYLFIISLIILLATIFSFIQFSIIS